MVDAPCRLGEIKFTYKPNNPLIELMEGHGVNVQHVTQPPKAERAWGVFRGFSGNPMLSARNGGTAINKGDVLRHDTVLCLRGILEQQE